MPHACGACPHLEGAAAGLRVRLLLAEDDFAREHEAHAATLALLHDTLDDLAPRAVALVERTRALLAEAHDLLARVEGARRE